MITRSVGRGNSPHGTHVVGRPVSMSEKEVKLALASDRKTHSIAENSAKHHAYFDAKTYNCDCYGCGKVAAMFIGNSRIGYLNFCSKHRAVAIALNLYLKYHSKAR